MGGRLYGIVAKELLELRRDALAVVLSLLIPVMMLFIFGWAINTDIKHVPTAVLDQSGGSEARELLEAFARSQYFDLRHRVASQRELARLLDGSVVKVGIVIPPDYARRLDRGRAEVQVVVDAADPMVATSAINAAAALGAERAFRLVAATPGGASLERAGPPLEVRVRAWYNPDLVSAIFIVPGLIGVLLMQTTTIVMSMSLVLERERGTLEALVVSPVRRWELLLGKILPNLLVSYGQMTLSLLVARLVFDVPIRGSLVLLYALSLFFMWGTLGLGILVSTFARTVPAAMQLGFLPLLPSIYLSGLLFPVEGMPAAAQWLARVIPLTYYLRVVRGIVLKGAGLELLWPEVLPLAAFGALVFTLATLRFRKQLE